MYRRVYPFEMADSGWDRLYHTKWRKTSTVSGSRMTRGREVNARFFLIKMPAGTGFNR